MATINDNHEKNGNANKNKNPFPRGKPPFLKVFGALLSKIKHENIIILCRNC